MNELFTKQTQCEDLPRLRVHHLMLWTVSVAVAMAISKVFVSEFGVELSSRDAIGLMVEVIPRAVALATLLNAAYWRFKGMKFLPEIGHGLLVIVSMEMLAPLGMLFYTMLSLLLEFTEVVTLVIFAAVPIAKGLFYILLGKKIVDTDSWRRFCYVIGCMYLVVPVFYFVLFIPAIDFPYVLRSLIQILLFAGGPLLWCALCVIALREDIAQGWQRHWSHWCGVVVWLILTGAELLFSIVSYFSSEWTSYPAS